jgi:transposase-like protein
VCATSPTPNLKDQTDDESTVDNATAFEQVISDAILACGQIARATSALDTQALDDVFIGAIRNGRRKQPRATSSEREAQIVAGHLAGKRVMELARQFGVHNATIRRILDKAGFRPSPPRLESLVDDVRAVYEAGATIMETARQFGASHASIHRLMVKRGIPGRSSSEP